MFCRVKGFCSDRSTSLNCLGSSIRIKPNCAENEVLEDLSFLTHDCFNKYLTETHACQKRRALHVIDLKHRKRAALHSPSFGANLIKCFMTLTTNLSRVRK